MRDRAEATAQAKELVSRMTLEEKASQLKTAQEDAERQKQDYQKEIDRLTEELRKEASKTWWQKLWHK